MMMKKLLLILLLIGIFPVTAQAQVTINATATPSNCLNTGSIKITATGLPSLVTYGIAKEPFSTTNIISGTSPEFSLLEPGKYYYGYYSGTTFVKSASTVTVTSSYSTISPTFSSGYNNTKFYTYCGTVDPLGNIKGQLTGGNGSFVVRLLSNTDDIIQEVGTK